MEGLRQWAITVCCTLIAGGIFTLLIPKEKFGKVMRFTIGLFFIISLISPFATVDIKADFSEYAWNEYQDNTQSFSAQVQEQYQNLVAKNLETSLMRQCREKGLYPEKITVDVHIGEDNCISITNVEVTAEGDVQRQAEELIEALLKE